MGHVKYWNPEIADDLINEIVMNRLERIGDVLAYQVKSTLRTQIKNPNYSRPPYKSGKYAGRWWTARDAGALLDSVRVVKRKQDIKRGHRNVWVIAGNSKAYYAPIYEYSKNPARGKKYFRPSISRAMPRMKAILSKGSVK